jgi:ribonuclease HI
VESREPVFTEPH